MRRDQRRLRLLLILLILTSITLITLDVRGSGGIGSLRAIVRDVVGPIESAASTVWRPIKDLASSIGHIGRDRATAKRLTKENQALQHQIDILEANKSAADEVVALQHLAGLGQYQTVFARVIAFRDDTGYEWTATIDAGSQDHLTKNMTVIAGNGLVGKIVAVSRETSLVLLINDPTSTVGARLEGSNDLGTVSGQGASPLLFNLLDNSTTIKAGQRVVTIGAAQGSIYAAGVPIGVVTKVINSPNGLSRQALVAPYVTMTSLDIVGVVVVQPRTDPRDSVLPQKPTPAPTVTVTATPSGSASPSATPTRSTNPSPTPHPTTSPPVP